MQSRPQTQLYRVHWCRDSRARPMSTWCEIFRSTSKQPKAVLIANHFMVKEEEETQSRSSGGRLEIPQAKDSWLTTQIWNESVFVSLQIRRLNKPPMKTELSDNKNLTPIGYKWDIDMRDDPKAGSPPYIVFKFEFRTAAPEPGMITRPLRSVAASRRGSGSSSSIQSSESSKNNPHTRRPNSQDQSNTNIPPRPPAGESGRPNENNKLPPQKVNQVAATSNHQRQPSGQVQTQSPEAIDLDSDGFADAAKTRPPEPSEKNESPSQKRARPSGDKCDVEGRLKRRRTIIAEKEQIKKANDLKHAQLHNLLKVLDQDTEAHAQKLAEEKEQAQQLDDEIKRIQNILAWNEILTVPED
ncbi:hypothetical protein C8J57DRAFT_1275219 [Mycena rebaudengoi]|nr:hypothetical protein C8J57DRAFT_1275219 [Mycena rebaudengoi]